MPGALYVEGSGMGASPYSGPVGNMGRGSVYWEL